MAAPQMSWTSTAGIATPTDAVMVPDFTDSAWETGFKGLTQCKQTEGSYIVDAKMLGGYHLLGGDVFGNTDILEKTIPNLPQGDYTLTYHFYHLDNWQGEKGYLQTQSGTFGYVERWSRNHTTGGSDGTQSVCGHDGYWDYAASPSPRSR